MESNRPSPQELRQYIKSLDTQIKALNKEKEAYVSALDAKALVIPVKKSRNRPETPGIAELKVKVSEVYRVRGQESLKLIELMRAVMEAYPEDSRPTEDQMRGKVNHLKNSGFLVSGDQYGTLRLSEKQVT